MARYEIWVKDMQEGGEWQLTGSVERILREAGNLLDGLEPGTGTLEKAMLRQRAADERPPETVPGDLVHTPTGSHLTASPPVALSAEELASRVAQGTLRRVFIGGLTTDRADPRLPVRRGFDESPVPQQAVYLVLSAEERARGFVRPVRRSYQHRDCGAITTMSLPLAETYAANPKFYTGTYCVGCRMHRPVAEFVWLDPTTGLPTEAEVGS